MTRPTVLVTGAAAGIGRAVATRFAANGYLVGAFDVDEAGLTSLADELGDAVLTGVLTGVLDVRDSDAWAACVADLTAASGGRLDVLVNNAGILRAGFLAEIPLPAQKQMVDVNVTGVVNGCHAAYAALKATPGAHVINLAPASAIYGQAELATYSASKFAVRGLTEALDLEWAKDDITVRAVWPLFVDTGMTQGVDIGSTRSLGIRLTPEDVADEILAAVQPSRFPRGVHHAAGRQAKLLLTSTAFAPMWAVRLVNKRITASH